MTGRAWMHEFESFVFLDVEKTGTAFTSALLRRYCSEKEILYQHHKPMPGGCDRSKFYFTNTRHPLDSYLSLYSFGLGLRGKMRGRLEATKADRYYDGTLFGFSKWLSFVLNPANAELFDKGYAKPKTEQLRALIGLQSYRYLKLALPGGTKALKNCETRDDIRETYEKHKLPQFHVRKESFHDDLCALVSGPLRHAFKNQEGALEYIRNGKPLNKSDRVDENGLVLHKSKRITAALKDREWFLFEVFGYGDEYLPGDSGPGENPGGVTEAAA